MGHKEDVLKAILSKQAEVNKKIKATKTMTPEVKKNLLEGSAIKDIRNRALWGYADDWGKKKILQREGYKPEDIVYENGSPVAVKVEGRGIQAVDPKANWKIGGISRDLPGDIAESLGKAQTSIGGTIGGVLSGANPLGMGAGAAAGEASRQGVGFALGVRDPNSIKDPSRLVVYKDKGGNIKIGPAGEVLAEGGIIIATTALTNKIFLRKLVPKGSTQPTVSDAVGKVTGTDERVGEQIVKGKIKSLPGGIDLRTSKYYSNAEEKVKAFAENARKIAGDVYSQTLKTAGVDESTYIKVTKEQADDVINTITKWNAGEKFIKDKNALEKIALKLKDVQTYGDLKEMTGQVWDLVDDSYENANATRLTGLGKQVYGKLANIRNKGYITPDGRFPIAEASKLYSEVLDGVDEARSLLRIPMEGGEVSTSYRSIAANISRLKDTKLQGTKLAKLDALDDFLKTSNLVSDELGPLKNYTFMDEINLAHTADKLVKKGKLSALNPISYVPGASKVAGLISEQLPVNKARAMIGLNRVGLLRPELAERQVNSIFPVASMISQILPGAKEQVVQKALTPTIKDLIIQKLQTGQ